MVAYASASELSSFLRILDRDEDPHLEALLETASRAIDEHCGRTFEPADASASERVYSSRFCDIAYADPISSTNNFELVVDGVTWSSADYQLEPLNRRAAGLSDHPYVRIRAIGGRAFPVTREALIAITAEWGWASGPPAPIRDATLLHAGRLHERRSMPAALVITEQISNAAMRGGMDSDVKGLVRPFVRVDQWI